MAVLALLEPLVNPDLKDPKEFKENKGLPEFLAALGNKD
jgi:hypothetical protein